LSKIFAKFVLILPLVLSACGAVGDDVCRNELKREIPSPDNRLKAVIFERDCGATVPPSTQISLLKTGENLSDGETGNVFISNRGFDEQEAADGAKRANTEIRWLDDKQLIVSFDDAAGVKPTRMKQQVEGVKIIYDHRRIVETQKTN
jgi:hypothetical protein